jgi:hypothetical protein
MYVAQMVTRPASDAIGRLLYPRAAAVTTAQDASIDGVPPVLLHFTEEI